jgi:hypothetical protein
MFLLTPRERMDVDLAELCESIRAGERYGESAGRAIRHWCRESGRRPSPVALRHALKQMLNELDRRGFLETLPC